MNKLKLQHVAFFFVFIIALVIMSIPLLRDQVNATSPINSRAEPTVIVNSVKTVVATSSQEKTATTSSASNWKMYHDDEYKYSFRYPSNFNLEISHPHKEYGAGYPLEYVRLIPPKLYYNNLEVKVSTMTHKELREKLARCKGINITGKAIVGIPPREVDTCEGGDAGFSGKEYYVELLSGTILTIGISSGEVACTDMGQAVSPGTISCDQVGTLTEEEIATFLSSFKFD